VWPAPKPFTAQTAVLAMLAIELGRRRHLSSDYASGLLNELMQIPKKSADHPQNDLIRQTHSLTSIRKTGCSSDADSTIRLRWKAR
jgi:glucosamine 6-phosphate synthetase-like amidotransferase/phosphosugar isomerase protein